MRRMETATATKIQRCCSSGVSIRVSCGNRYTPRLRSCASASSSKPPSIEKQPQKMQTTTPIAKGFGIASPHRNAKPILLNNRAKPTQLTAPNGTLSLYGFGSPRRPQIPRRPGNHIPNALNIPMIMRKIASMILKYFMRSRRLTKKAEPPPTCGENRDSGTDSANGGWLRREPV